MEDCVREGEALVPCSHFAAEPSFDGGTRSSPSTLLSFIATGEALKRAIFCVRWASSFRVSRITFSVRTVPAMPAEI